MKKIISNLPFILAECIIILIAILVSGCASTENYVEVILTSKIKSVSYVQMDVDCPSRIGTEVTLENGHTTILYGTDLMGQDAIGKSYTYYVKINSKVNLNKDTFDIVKTWESNGKYYIKVDVGTQYEEATITDTYYISYYMYHTLNYQDKQYLTNEEMKQVLKYNNIKY